MSSASDFIELYQGEALDHDREYFAVIDFRVTEIFHCNLHVQILHLLLTNKIQYLRML
jgi:hypothetical protein